MLLLKDAAVVKTTHKTMLSLLRGVHVLCDHSLVVLRIDWWSWDPVSFLNVLQIGVDFDVAVEPDKERRCEFEAAPSSLKMASEKGYGMGNALG